MIRYTLRCEKEHHFEEWFDNMADYDAKAEAGGLTCPECGSKDVSKAIMAPSIGSLTVSSKGVEAPCGAPSCGAGMCPSMRG